MIINGIVKSPEPSMGAAAIPPTTSNLSGGHAHLLNILADSILRLFRFVSPLVFPVTVCFAVCLDVHQILFFSSLNDAKTGTANLAPLRGTSTRHKKKEKEKEENRDRNQTGREKKSTATGCQETLREKS